MDNATQLPLEERLQLTLVNFSWSIGCHFIFALNDTRLFPNDKEARIRLKELASLMRTLTKHARHNHTWPEVQQTWRRTAEIVYDRRANV